ncbi:hypothetical protein ACQY0O_001092 [Thecaphora frezii]
MHPPTPLGVLRPHLSPASPALRRTFASSSAYPARRQHLLWSGHLLGSTSSRLTPLPRSWLDSLGVSPDIDQGLQWTHLSASNTHALLAYRLLPRPHASQQSDHDADIYRHAPDPPSDSQQQQQLPSSLPHKVVAVGTNTHAQLGLGFASQEATRGMVTGSLDGRGGITGVYAGGCTSFVVTDSTAHDSRPRSQLYAFGNHTLGQLGLGPSSSSSHSSDPYDVTPRQESGEAHLVLHPLPQPVDLDDHRAHDDHAAAAGKEGWTIDHVASGIDHTLLIRSRTAAGGAEEQQVMSTGVNTDGQLGLSTTLSVPITPLIARTFRPVPLPVLGAGDRWVQVAAGADTSFALAASGRLFAWGNSEYGQAMLPSGVEDRVQKPVEVTEALQRAYRTAAIEVQGEARVRKVVAGGSWAGVLDDCGRVWTVGYGALGLGEFVSMTSDPSLPPAPLSSVELSHVSSLPAGITDLYSGLDYAVAVAPAPASNETEASPARLPRLYTWGLDTASGRLGLGLGTTSSPLDRLRMDPSRPVDRASGGAVEKGRLGQPGRSPSAAVGARAYKPVEIAPFRLGMSPEEKWMEDTPAQKRKLEAKQEEEKGKVGDAKVLAVGCGNEALFVLLEDGRGDVGRWCECFARPEPGMEVDV